jgi:hypothetical protein
MTNRLARFNQFNSEFEDEIGKHPTYEKAYLATEERFKQKVGFNQYSGYDSFRTVRGRSLKAK